MKLAGATSSALVLTLCALLCTSTSAGAATVTEFYDGISLDSTPADITAGPDGNMWFTEPGVDQVAKITPAGAVTEFFEDIELDTGPLGITSGPDGNLWFTEYDAGQIGRITPAGVVTEFFEGLSPNSSPRDIAVGADGNLWFTDTNGRRIGRITPAGVVTEFDVNSGIGGGPLAITAGPDGNLWFTEGPGGVGRMTTAGAFTRFLDAYRDLPGIASGPDGNLWTTEYLGAIRRMTPAGVVTGTFALPSGLSPNGITTGPDDNLWFAASGDAVGRITPAGAVAIVTGGISDGSFPRDIATGPDGNLWFTEPGTDQVARVTPSIEAPVVAATDATAVATTSATLNGTIDARSLATTTQFEYGTTTAYGSQPPVQAADSSSPAPVSAALTGLQPATTYHYRLVASSGGGSAQSADRTFTTAALPVPPPPPPPPACSNGLDDDRDGFADAADPRCHADGNRRNAASYRPQTASEAPVDNPLVACSAGGLALVSAELIDGRRRIRLRGVADPGQAGKRVGLYAGGRRAGDARVQTNGSFQATFRAARRAPARVRYQARLGTRRSQSLVAQRRFAGVKLAVSGGKVVLSGRTVGRRPRSVELRGRAGGCGAFKTLATARVRANRTFSVSATAFADVDIATFRVRIAAAGAAGARESTAPQAIRLR